MTNDLPFLSMSSVWDEAAGVGKAVLLKIGGC